MQSLETKTTERDSALQLVPAPAPKRQEPKPDLQDAALVLAEMFHETLAWNSDSETWMLWTGTHWSSDSRIATDLDECAIRAMRGTGVPINNAASLTSVIRMAKVPLTRRPQEREGLVNFRNGTLDVRTMELHEHRKEDDIEYCLPYDYNTQATPAIEHFLRGAIPDPFARQAVKVHIGRGLLRDQSLATLLVLKGKPRSGKSVLMQLANAVAGAEIVRGNPAALSEFAGHSLFDQGTEGKRARAIWNKRLIVCADEVNSDAFRNEEALKTMSAHSGVEQRRIGVDESMNNTWRPVLFLATNDTPNYKDVSGALRRRIIPVIFPRSRSEGEIDNRLIHKLVAEIGGFAHQCIVAALEAIGRGGYRRSNAMMAVLEDWGQITDPVRAVMNESFVLDPNARISIKRAYALVQGYCTDMGKSAPSATEMTKRLKDMGVGVETGRNITCKDVDYGGGTQKAIKGIRLRRNTDPPATEFALDPNDYSEYVASLEAEVPQSGAETVQGALMSEEELVGKVVGELDADEHAWCVESINNLAIAEVKVWLNAQFGASMSGSSVIDAGRGDGLRPMPPQFLNRVIARLSS